MKLKYLLCIHIVVAFSGFTYAQAVKAPLVSAIKEKDIKSDMYALAADAFLGREAGTLDELKVSMWLANKAEACGMKPAGENGTFFQFFEMYRYQVSPQSAVQIDQRKLTLWKDYLVTSPVNTHINAPVFVAGNVEPEDLKSEDVKGKVVVISVSPKNISQAMTLFVRRYPGFVKDKYYYRAKILEAKALVFLTDDIADKSWEEVLPQMTRGSYRIDELSAEFFDEAMPILWVKRENSSWFANAKQISLDLIVDTYKYPSVNIIGKIEGTDPQLKNEYVLVSGHQDHDGIRQPVQGDTIYNGADDNASTCVAMLAMARAYKAQPAKRSVLFVFHGAEERGLLGSRWHAAHPVVAKNKIVAVLNGDMIGRNAIDEAALLGGIAPHKNSEALVKMAEEANDESTKFKYLRDWDNPNHAEYFYFRSDHLPYAREGIPAIFFTSVLHSQYHTPQDESENINFPKLFKMTEWMYRTSWKVANAATKPDLISQSK